MWTCIASSAYHVLRTIFLIDFEMNVVNTTILGFETAINQTSLGLYYDNTYKVINSDGGRGQTQQVLPNIDELLHQQNLTVKDIDGIAYSHGPGSFTGLRVAASIIQALAFVGEIPVVGVSSLKALAYAAAQQAGKDGGRYIVCCDAKMSEVYWAVYDVICDGEGFFINTIQEDSLCRPDEFAQQLEAYATANTAAVGDGWLLAEVKKNPMLTCSQENARLKPSAQYVVELALPQFLEKQTLKTHEVIPIYLRDRTAWKTLKQQREERSQNV